MRALLDSRSSRRWSEYTRRVLGDVDEGSAPEHTTDQSLVTARLEKMAADSAGGGTRADLKAVALRWFEEWWNLRRDDVLEEVTVPDCVAVLEGLDTGQTRDGLRQHRRAWLSAVPDMHVDVRLAVTEDTTVIVHWR